MPQRSVPWPNSARDPRGSAVKIRVADRMRRPPAADGAGRIRPRPAASRPPAREATVAGGRTAFVGSDRAFALGTFALFRSSSLHSLSLWEPSLSFAAGESRSRSLHSLSRQQPSLSLALGARGHPRRPRPAAFAAAPRKAPPPRPRAATCGTGPGGQDGGAGRRGRLADVGRRGARRTGEGRPSRVGAGGEEGGRSRVGGASRVGRGGARGPGPWV